MSLLKKSQDIATKFVVASTPLLVIASAHAADDNTITTGTLGVNGLPLAAASVFAVKAGPSLMMWGYRKILGFIGR